MMKRCLDSLDLRKKIVLSARATLQKIRNRQLNVLEFLFIPQRVQHKLVISCQLIGLVVITFPKKAGPREERLMEYHLPKIGVL
ncbi:hypothetical protein D3C76_1171970 [compost metagenome]